MRSHIPRLALIFVLFLSVAVCAQTPIAIRTNTARARKQPDTNAAVIATLHKGETFVVTKDLPYWYRLKLRNGATAYVAKSLCVVVEDEDETEWEDEVPAPSP